MAPKLSFSLKDISKYRSELMGFSIVWIMMLHFQFEIVKPLGFIAQYGFAGVEIFMFVSGLGIYYSLDKNRQIIPYYLKRIRRIFPAYYIVGIFASLFLYNDNLFIFLFRYTTIGYWIDKPFFEWYIPSIIAYYLIAPFFYSILQSRYRAIIIIFSIFIIASSFFIARYQYMERIHFFCYYRLPAFLLGMYCGMLCKSNTKSIKYYYTFLIVGIPFFAIFFPMHHAIYEFKYYSLFFLLPTFMLFFCTASKYLGIIGQVVKMVGDASLEIYLIQTLFFYAIIQGLIVISHQWHDIITFTLICLCSLLGILMHKSLKLIL